MTMGSGLLRLRHWQSDGLTTRLDLIHRWSNPNSSLYPYVSLRLSLCSWQIRGTCITIIKCDTKKRMRLHRKGRPKVSLRSNGLRVLLFLLYIIFFYNILTFDALGGCSFTDHKWFAPGPARIGPVNMPSGLMSQICIGQCTIFLYIYVTHAVKRRPLVKWLTFKQKGESLQHYSFI